MGLEQELPSAYIKDSVCHACYELMANQTIVAFLNGLATNFEFTRKVAYGRVHFLNETRMVELLKGELTKESAL